MLEIVFENEQLIAINKPHGLLVHKSRIAKDAKIFALQLLRDQIGQRVYLTHRLDRKTSGVLLFAKDKKTNAQVQQLFSERKVKKTYKALVRGFVEDKGLIDYPLTENKKTKAAQTEYELLEKFEIPLPSGQFTTSRYSLVKLMPKTGRYHQLRKHMAHIFHPIIGDRPHGCNKQNRLWKQHFQMMTMLLHAESLVFDFPTPIKIKASMSKEFQAVLGRLEARRFEIGDNET